MGFIYNLGIYVIDWVLKSITPINNKIKKGVFGRSKTFKTLENNITLKDRTLWFHCASLGEYEQGFPVFKALRKHYKNHKIILSFFSPSGYEIQKNSPIADVVIYLPIDSKKNAKRFIDILNPELTVFVKYDLWPNFLSELKHRKLRAVLISALFRTDQIYFKFYGKKFRTALFAFEHIFVQNDISRKLLLSIEYNHVTVSGDTRFDRVLSQLELDNTLDFISSFKNNKPCIVAGSTWPEDDVFLINYINNEAPENVKFIIAPHNIKSTQIENFKTKVNTEVTLFTEKESSNLKDASVIIIDVIGLLAKIYSYADIAYVGGAMGNTGLHNTLEPAVFGVPIIIGKNHSKFPEAKQMIQSKGLFSVSNQKEFNIILNKLIANKEKRQSAGKNNFNFIKQNNGADIQILDYLRI